ncbi:MAG: hypothetical protein CME64_18030 [Halobacteriovoraceae bacterium]|nr:hypothetical protein [Halobacteriovoraceae bacterium]|tara:strand:+ start:2701 stop:3807 length:1107 start_codon:yes stop_codon:yes gene_type:complete
MNRYKKLPGHKNVRKDLKTGKYQAYKTIDEQQYSKDFTKLGEAKRWLLTFSPEKEAKKKASPKFREVWQEYQDVRFSDLEHSSIEAKTARIKVFYKDVKDTHMEDFNADFFKELILRKKRDCEYNRKRLSFDKEIKEYKVIFNWYRDYKDYKFIIPLTKFHNQLGKIKKSVPKNKRMSVQQVQRFFDSFENELFKKFAITQFFSCARVSEIAGLQTHSIDLQEGMLLIKDVVVWSKQKVFVELKPYTKNNDVKYVRIVKPLYDIFVDRLSGGDNCSYVFHINGEPLNYRQIQHHYDRAFKKAGLPQFSGTHTLRHSMASIARELSGSMDAVQSLTGHKSIRQAEHYAGLGHSAQLKALDCVTQAIRLG